ncbi:putative biological adhesion [Lyophyllum shimeji]|uniref:Biological adhesion n=1 Tax=Lyophyllum shimeji TaxID=47721 RepID=A0A9P3UIL8_LYOSH|nr:putative biological adhesion [Lyophyllum shimeji]
MSDADRAAKAARAKALLKKRQQQKAGGVSATTTNSGVASPISPSRTLSPAPQVPAEEDKRDLGDVFTKDDSDMSWLSSLPRAPSPPPRITSPSLASPQPVNSVASSALALNAPANHVDSKQSENASLSAEVKRLQALELEAQQKIASLEQQRMQLNEKIAALQSASSSLAAQVKSLEAAELKAQQTEALLQEQRTRTKGLEDQLQWLEDEKARALQNEQQTISLLVSEKSSLVAEVQRLGDVETKANALETSLEEERQRSKALDEQLQRVQAAQQQAEKVIREFQAKEKELNERCREKDRELQHANATTNDLKHQLDQHQRRVRELEEQIQSDDRVERLENSLKNTQDRADELEFQLSKLKQAHSTLKVDRDDIEAQRRLLSTTVTELETKFSELQGVHKGILEQLAIATAAKDALTQEKSEIQSEVDSMRSSVSDLQDKLVQATATIASNSRQLQTLQSQLKAATRRAEDAEQTQKDLQLEGTNLMRSLDEMRPKIVELTGAKLELTETVSYLELDLRNARDRISHLESKLKEAARETEELQTRLQEMSTQHEKERALLASDSSELQKTFTQLQEELDTAHASLRNLETERASHHQETARRLEDIERLTSLSRANAEEIAALRQELDSVRDAQHEGQTFLERAQNEIESLRTDLNTREDELQHLRDVVASPTRTNGPQSLDDELISSLRQQHALDLSAAQSQIRALENSVFDANARAHLLQKQVNALEDQLARQRSSSRVGQRSFSPVPSGLRPASRNSDLQRSSFGSHRPGSVSGAPPLARSIFDQNMSAETRHKRLVSLSMLKARIDSEVEVTVSRPSSRASSVRPLSPVQSGPGSRSGSPHSHSHSHSHFRSLSNSRAGVAYRPQFLDDSHVFWCHSCTGDLVIL